MPTNKLQVYRYPNSCVGYHFIILKDGKIYQTRKISEEGAHCIGMNTSSIGVCVVGNFTPGSPDMITQAQIDAYKTLIKKLMLRHNILTENIQNHRDYASYKDCPGDKFYDSYFRDLVRQDDVITETDKIIKEQMNIVAALIALVLQLLQKQQARALSGVFKKSSFREIIN